MITDPNTKVSGSNTDTLERGNSKGSPQKVKLTERIQLRTTKNLHILFKESKELFNRANLLVIKGFCMPVLIKSTQKEGKMIRYRALERELHDTLEYKALPSHTAQQILLQVERAWNSFFESLKEWKKNPNKFLGRPQPPKIKGETDENLLFFTNLQCRIKEDLLYFPKKIIPPIKVNPERVGKLQQVRVLPRGFYSIVEIVYNQKIHVPSLDKSQRKRVIGIDLGVRNLVTVVNNFGQRPFIIKGGLAKSINQFYNKQRAKYQAINKDHGITFQTRKQQRLDRVRNNKIDDLFHRVSRAIVNYCLHWKIGTIVIGYNKLWKQEVNLGRGTNQKFVNIPYQRLVQKIQYKAAMEGISVVLEEEDHTSKCSFLDNEPIEHHENYMGKRGIYISKKNGGKGGVHYGLFRTSKGIIVNSDVNGGYNILKKAFPKAISADGIDGLGLVPYSVSPAELNNNLNLTQTTTNINLGGSRIESF